MLKSLRQDVADQLGVAPERAVVSVPALFELPQSAAASEAARLAGFERVELIQEPVASALAAGWTRTGGMGRGWSTTSAAAPSTCRCSRRATACCASSATTATTSSAGATSIAPS